MIFKKNPKKNNKLLHRNREIEPDEIFLDSSNLPKFDRTQFEGRLEKPIGKHAVVLCGLVFLLISLLYAGRVWTLQIKEGDAYGILSEKNSLHRSLVFASRGVVYDRNGKILVSNVPSDTDPEFSHRLYADITGLSHIVGYVKYPSKDTSGFYYTQDYEGLDGVEKLYDEVLRGLNGMKIVETDVAGRIQSESVLEPARDGGNLTLSIDSRIDKAWYEFMDGLAGQIGFGGAAGLIMDTTNGEIISAVSYPEYRSGVMSDGKDAKAIQNFVTDPRKPFLNRAFDGLYTPGSIVKPFIALAALNENIISPTKPILSTGSIEVPNPYDPTKKSIFKDWRAQGWVDMKKAIAVSSDVYFYEIGGGFKDQKGLGITAIDRYLKLFGLGESDPTNPLLSKSGTIPNPEWKKQNFKGESWLLGDTYNTAIGQYGVQVTPIQMVRAVAAIANDGRLLSPTILKEGNAGQIKYFSDTPFPKEYFTVVKEGMRDSVKEGTSVGLNIPEVVVAAKTGTAELGTQKKYVNSWVIGFFPYDRPRYAFAALMEKGPYSNTIGALYVVRQLLEWMSVNTPEYLK